ncbi:MAG: type II toxin-antitoxin system VapC family toxin, partial [Salinisphaera sp.]|nr:type II toxin-antitoxin system VapC family toxin [Salinisphaera sp.]
MGFLLDTNTVSETRRIGVGNQNVLRWAAEQPLERLFISVITLFEIERGILLLERHDQVQANRLRRWFEVSVLPSFEGRIIFVDQQISRVCAPFHVPNKRPLADSMIAATAVVHDLTVA